jgi:hypothetical protein
MKLQKFIENIRTKTTPALPGMKEFAPIGSFFGTNRQIRLLSGGFARFLPRSDAD